MFDTIAARWTFLVTLLKTSVSYASEGELPVIRGCAEYQLTFTLRFLQVLHPDRDLVCFWIEVRGVILVPVDPAAFGDLDGTRADEPGEACEDGVADISFTTPDASFVARTIGQLGSQYDEYLDSMRIGVV
jgi:hypothetical protein